MNTRKMFRPLMLTAAVIGMGFTLPSCPGQEAMQQQIDGLQQKNAELVRRVSTLEASNKKIGDDMVQVSKVMNEMTGTIGSQKMAIDQLGAAVKELQARAMAAPAPKSKARVKTPIKRHR